MSIETSTSTNVAEVDIFDPRWWVDGPPHELFARLRAEAPVHWYQNPDGTGYWSVFRHADIHRISHDSETFSSARGGGVHQPRPGGPAGRYAHDDAGDGSAPAHGLSTMPIRFTPAPRLGSHD